MPPVLVSSEQRAVSLSLTDIAAPFLQLSILLLLLTSPKHATGRCNKRIVEGVSTYPSRRSGEPAGRSSSDYFQRSRHRAVWAFGLGSSLVLVCAERNKFAAWLSRALTVSVWRFRVACLARAGKDGTTSASHQRRHAIRALHKSNSGC